MSPTSSDMTCPTADGSLKNRLIASFTQQLDYCRYGFAISIVAWVASMNMEYAMSAWGGGSEQNTTRKDPTEYLYRGQFHRKQHRGRVALDST
jgi:hypothetical protein